MDKKPFLIVNLLALKENSVIDLLQFHKSQFEVNAILAKAKELKYINQIRMFLAKQFNSPDNDFVNYVIADIYNGRKTQRIIEDFRPILKKAFNQLITEIVSTKLQTDTEIPELPAVNLETEKKSADEKIETFYIIKSLVHDCLNDKNINFNDSENIFEIFLDNNESKCLCRIDFKAMVIFIKSCSEDKEFIKRQIRSIEDIYFYKNLLCQAVQKFN